MITAAPGLFVVLWSTGFIGAKLGLPYAEPFTFLALRYALVSAALFVVLLAAGSPWPRSPADVFHSVVAGLLLHGVHNGAAARVASLFYLVPPVTALFAWKLFDERLGTLALAGMAIAVAGVALVNFSERANALFRR